MRLAADALRLRHGTRAIVLHRFAGTVRAIDVVLFELLARGSIESLGCRVDVAPAAAICLGTTAGTDQDEDG